MTDNSCCWAWISSVTGPLQHSLFPDAPSCCADQSRKLGKRSHRTIWSARQPLGPLAIAIAPYNPHAKGRGRVSVPCIRRLECNGDRRDTEPINGKLIDFRVGLVDSDFFNGENRVEHRVELGGLDGGVEHRG